MNFQDIIYSALIHQHDYLVDKCCEDNMLNETRLKYVADLRRVRSAQRFVMKHWDDHMWSDDQMDLPFDPD